MKINFTCFSVPFLLWALENLGRAYDQAWPIRKEHPPLTTVIGSDMTHEHPSAPVRCPFDCKLDSESGLLPGIEGGVRWKPGPEGSPPAPQERPACLTRKAAQRKEDGRVAKSCIASQDLSLGKNNSFLLKAV